MRKIPKNSLPTLIDTAKIEVDVPQYLNEWKKTLKTEENLRQLNDKL